MQADFVRLDQDILTPLAGKKKLYTFETNDFWEQIKTPGWVVNSVVLSKSFFTRKLLKLNCALHRSYVSRFMWWLEVFGCLCAEDPAGNSIFVNHILN